MVTDPGAHRLRRHSEQALRFPCVGWMAETGIVDEASWTGRDTSKRQELPRFKHDLPHPTSLESGKVFRNHESSDSPLAVPYQINPFGFSMQANFVRMRGLTPFASSRRPAGTTGTSVTLYPGTSVTHELFFFVSFVECFWCGREMKAVGLKNPSTPNERLPKCRFA